MLDDLVAKFNSREICSLHNFYSPLVKINDQMSNY